MLAGTGWAGVPVCHVCRYWLVVQVAMRWTTYNTPDGLSYSCGVYTILRIAPLFRLYYCTSYVCDQPTLNIAKMEAEKHETRLVVG